MTAQISYLPALRNSAGVVVPLVVVAATGQLLAGLTASLGTLQVAFSDGPEPYKVCACAYGMAGAGAGGTPCYSASRSSVIQA